MSQRDSGWIQLYAESNQAAVDLHVQAFKLAEELSLPVMVCMDGFVLTHAVEPLEIPSQEQVDAFLPPYEPRQVLDPDEPVTIGAMVGPEAFTEVRYLAHAKQMQALDLVPELAAEFAASFGRPSGGLLRRYRTEGAETILVALGSVLGTIEDVVDELRDQGVRIGALGITCFRPFPLDEIREALADATRVIVVERAFAVGIGGIVGQNVRLALAGLPPVVYDVVAGLGDVPSPGARSPGWSRTSIEGGSSRTASTSSTWTGSSWNGSSSGSRRSAAPARTRRTSCATSASSPRRSH